MDIVRLIIIFIGGAGASAFGALIGGASLINIPLLIVLGLPPHVAIGTDRFGVMGIGWAGLFKFHLKGFEALHLLDDQRQFIVEGLWDRVGPR